MREKIIYDGRVDGSVKEVQEVIDSFLNENLYLPNIDFGVEQESQKQIWVIYPPGENTQLKKIVNGYVEISQILHYEEMPIIDF